MRSSIRTTLCAAALVAACAAVPAGVALGYGEPGVETYSPKAVTSTSATLSGVVDPGGSTTNYWFELGTTTAYGTSTASASTSGWSSVQVSKAVSGLTPGTTYHVRLVASNNRGTKAGDDVVFTTQGTAPGPTPASSPAPTPAAPAPAPKPGGPKSTPTGTTNGTAGTPSGTTPDADASADPTGITPITAGEGTPELGRSVAIEPASGTVTVLVPGSNRAVSLSDAAEIPMGSVLDTRDGTVKLRTALADGTTQEGTFHGGMFEVRQSRTGTGMTELVLRGPAPTCSAKSARAASLRKRQPPRGLWGHDDHGRFRTRGSNSVATVRGTTWYVADTCQGTVTRVTSGTVSVQDVHKHRTVVVKAGHSYLARSAH
ncbi:MAG: hypothetical protein QOG35_3161 [Solirubrobacteraceae bacterium]|jgi:hypothetical protein|nr:hypothetical protein [Solirubrobacteraceae bacterium]